MILSHLPRFIKTDLDGGSFPSKLLPRTSYKLDLHEVHCDITLKQVIPVKILGNLSRLYVDYFLLYRFMKA